MPTASTCIRRRFRYVCAARTNLRIRLNGHAKNRQIWFSSGNNGVRWDRLGNVLEWPKPIRWLILKAGRGNGKKFWIGKRAN